MSLISVARGWQCSRCGTIRTSATDFYRDGHEECKPAVGVWTITNGFAIELVGIDHGMDESAVLRYYRDSVPDGGLFGKPIKYTADDEARAYIEWNGMALYLDECMRISTVNT